VVEVEVEVVVVTVDGVPLALEDSISFSVDRR